MPGCVFERFVCCFIPCLLYSVLLPFFFFNDTATTEIYTLSLHDALPICRAADRHGGGRGQRRDVSPVPGGHRSDRRGHLRSEEHTSELQSHSDLVCRLLLEKKKNKNNQHSGEARERQ